MIKKKQNVVSRMVREQNQVRKDGRVNWGVKPDVKPFQKGVTFKEVPGGSEVSPKRQRFLDNIEQRVERALDRIRLVRQCFHPGNYDWTKEEGDKVYDALFDAISEVANAANRKSEKKRNFKL